jgi:acyl-CoA synthetase (AMP-forming)/AMP-acid ligase II
MLRETCTFPYSIAAVLARHPCRSPGDTGIFGFVDREGGGRRLAHDAPAIAAALKSHPLVRDVAVIAYPDRRLGSGLYAFVEVSGAISEQALRETVMTAARWRRRRPPEFVQTVDALPRGPSGSVRTEILQLVVMNQIESIDSLIAGERERTVVEKIVAGRRNLRDRYSL